MNFLKLKCIRFLLPGFCFGEARSIPVAKLPKMKLENIKVNAKLRESPAALFKVNKLKLSEDEKSIMISSLNGKKQ